MRTGYSSSGTAILHILREDVNPNLAYPLPGMSRPLTMVGRALCGSHIFHISEFPVEPDCGTCIRIQEGRMKKLNV